MTLRVVSLSHQAAAVYHGKGRSQPTCRAMGSRDRLGIPKPPPPGGGHAPRGAPSTRAARSLGRTHRPRLPGARCPRATSCQRPPCVSRAAHHRAKRRAGVWCSLPMLGPCAQRQRYATACCAYRPCPCSRLRTACAAENTNRSGHFARRLPRQHVLALSKNACEAQR